MSAVLSFLRAQLARATVLFTLFALSACIDAGPGQGPSVNTNRAVPVALLIPHESPRASDATLARSLENAARLAMADLDGVNIDLRVYATGGQPEMAAAAATRAVNDGAKIILGPVFAPAANAAGVAVANRNVNILSFSNNTSIAGGNVFVLGNSYRNTASRLAQFAVAQGRNKIMVVHGNNSNESRGRDAITSAVQASGGTVTATAGFELSQNGVIQSAPGISREARNNGSNAIFFTSGGAGALGLTTQMLRENGVTQQELQFIGLRRMDRPATMLTQPGVQGGWFATPDARMQQTFISRYTAAYGGAPHPIAGVAYDGMAAVGALLKTSRSDALTVNSLTQSSGFAGVSGVFRLLPDGSAQRALAVSTIRGGVLTEISPAPRSFGGAGF
ncbi:penicillin-binding protein activator [Halocynthiibacter namhaensis]|uniref:penicillin-binding protein activator n=1 Tax=Halocynthiibacter namhaensis TaxID=1290553 RepID=UPI000578FB6C|nr:penicillin-binding protein activator [Halocynthiibacter namhaensis]